MGLWGGIVGDEVAVSGTSLPRSRVRFVCPERCPDNLPSQPAEQDTVVWKDGTRTGGRVEVRCENNSNSQCYISQDGKPSKPKSAKQAGPGSWNDVNYVYLKN